jgi:hypothetical protein
MEGWPSATTAAHRIADLDEGARRRREIADRLPHGERLAVTECPIAPPTLSSSTASSD